MISFQLELALQRVRYARQESVNCHRKQQDMETGGTLAPLIGNWEGAEAPLHSLVRKLSKTPRKSGYESNSVSGFFQRKYFENDM